MYIMYSYSGWKELLLSGCTINSREMNNNIYNVIIGWERNGGVILINRITRTMCIGFR